MTISRKNSNLLNWTSYVVMEQKGPKHVKDLEKFSNNNNNKKIGHTGRSIYLILITNSVSDQNDPI
jgi:hypothetical protein